MSTTLTLQRTSYPTWHCGFCEDKLVVRGQLPGASIFDRSVRVFREAHAAGLSLSALLPPATSGSWMVNNKVPSPQFQQWLQGPSLASLERLLDILSGDTAQWRTRTQEERATVEEAIKTLWTPNYGIVGISKVLAMLCPDVVPLMDDAACWFALDIVPCPKTASTAQAGPEVFLQMLDWFTSQVEANLEALQQLADFYEECPMSPAQLLDRLLWFESWGYHIMQGAPLWRWVRDGEREGIIPVIPLTELPKTAHDCLDVGEIEHEEWQEKAQLAIELTYHPPG